MNRLRGLVGVLLLVFAWAPALPTQEQLLRVHFVDVGQGDGVVIQSPSGQNVVYDAGENPERMRGYLREIGVTQVGLAIASHNHADHIGGLTEILRFARPQFYMDNGIPATTQTYARLLQAVQGAGSQVMEPTARRILMGDAALTVLPPPGIAAWDQNDNSVGAMVEYGLFRLSLAGDAEPREWSWWLTHHPDLLGEVQVHKASHHGSINGDTAAAVEQLSPEAVVVSAGLGNSYGHPEPAALQRYAAQGAIVYRTDLQGTIVVEARSSGTFTVSVERGEGALPAPGTATPAPSPAPTPGPLPTPSSVWSGSLPPRSSGSHPVCQVSLPAIAACVNARVGTPQAVCNDNAFSCSVGSGTCSGHGGVYCWRH